MHKSQWQISRGFVRFLLICFLLWLCLYYFVFPRLAGGGRAKVQRAHFDEIQLSLSIENYKQEFGSYPTGESANVVKVLAGENPKHLRLFYPHAKSTNRNNEFIDPWETPYRFVFDATNHFKVRSAGVDRTFGDPDDIVFNSVSNNFVQP